MGEVHLQTPAQREYRPQLSGSHSAVPVGAKAGELSSASVWKERTESVLPPSNFPLRSLPRPPKCSNPRVKQNLHPTSPSRNMPPASYQPRGKSCPALLKEKCRMSEKWREFCGWEKSCGTVTLGRKDPPIFSALSLLGSTSPSAPDRSSCWPQQRFLHIYLFLV